MVPLETGLQVNVCDDGSGIDDPARIVALGASNWSEAVATSEDPAGMGVFALAGRNTVISSRHRTQATGWKATIGSDAWTGEKDINVEPCGRDVGTTVSFVLDGIHEGTVETALADAAKYYPLPVTFHGKEKARSDFLAGAAHRVEWNGSTIGIFVGRPYHRTPTVNFHGVTIFANLITIDSTKRESYHARIDIGSTPSLQLVLPARKEFVENEGLEDLRSACERAIFSYIATLEEHHLSFEDWQRAKTIGIDLPEAKPELESWEPDTGDSDDGSPCGEPTTIDGDQFICDTYGAHFDQAIARALAGAPIRQRLVTAKPAYEGYSWYDELRIFDDPKFTVRLGTEEHVIDEIEASPPIDGHHEATSIELNYRIIETVGDQAERESVSSDIVTLFPDGCCSDGLDNVTVIYLKSERLDPPELVDFLEASCFSAWNDSDADSWDTQHDRFLRDARELAHRLLEGEDAAIASQFRDAIARISWALPKGKKVTIAFTHDSPIDVNISEHEQQT